jgi:small subunit ribosomal protein S9
MATTAAKKEYIEAVGRRKNAIARVRLYEDSKMSFSINEDRDLENYFPVAEHRKTVTDPFQTAKIDKKFKVTAKIEGGGVNSQAEALRLGISRALIALSPELRTIVKKAGFLKRDARVKERRKFGLKKARKAPQWSKR